MHNIKNQEAFNLNLKKKRQPIDTKSKMTQMLELLDKYSEAAIKMLQQTIINMLETNGLSTVKYYPKAN